MPPDPSVVADPYRGLGGRYVIRDGKRVPADAAAPATAVATSDATVAAPTDGADTPQEPPAAVTAVNFKRSRKGR